MKAKTIVLLVLAVAAGVTAAVLVVSRGAPRAASDDADYYCYQLKQAWVCAYARSECETRLARENTRDVQKRCTPHSDVPLTP